MKIGEDGLMEIIFCVEIRDLVKQDKLLALKTLRKKIKRKGGWSVALSTSCLPIRGKPDWCFQPWLEAPSSDDEV